MYRKLSLPIKDDVKIPSGAIMSTNGNDLFQREGAPSNEYEVLLDIRYKRETESHCQLLEKYTIKPTNQTAFVSFEWWKKTVRALGIKTPEQYFKLRLKDEEYAMLLPHCPREAYKHKFISWNKALGSEQAPAKVEYETAKLICDMLQVVDGADYASKRQNYDLEEYLPVDFQRHYEKELKSEADPLFKNSTENKANMIYRSENKATTIKLNDTNLRENGCIQQNQTAAKSVKVSHARARIIVGLHNIKDLQQYKQMYKASEAFSRIMPEPKALIESYEYRADNGKKFFSIYEEYKRLQDVCYNAKINTKQKFIEKFGSQKIKEYGEIFEGWELFLKVEQQQFEKQGSKELAEQYLKIKQFCYEKQIKTKQEYEIYRQLGGYGHILVEEPTQHFSEIKKSIWDLLHPMAFKQTYDYNLTKLVSRKLPVTNNSSFRKWYALSVKGLVMPSNITTYFQPQIELLESVLGISKQTLSKEFFKQDQDEATYNEFQTTMAFLGINSIHQYKRKKKKIKIYAAQGIHNPNKHFEMLGVKEPDCFNEKKRKWSSADNNTGVLNVTEQAKQQVPAMQIEKSCPGEQEQLTLASSVIEIDLDLESANVELFSVENKHSEGTLKLQPELPMQSELPLLQQATEHQQHQQLLIPPKSNQNCTDASASEPLQKLEVMEDVHEELTCPEIEQLEMHFDQEKTLPGKILKQLIKASNMQSINDLYEILTTHPELDKIISLKGSDYTDTKIIWSEIFDKTSN